jgi:hypothetical protein
LPNSILDNIVIEVDAPQEIAKSLRSKDLQSVAEVYSKNVSDILGLLAIPYSTLFIGINKTLQTQFYLQAVAEKKILLKSKEDEAAVRAHAEHLLNQATEDKNSPHNPHKQTNEILGKLLENKKMSDAVRALLFASISSGWAAFESVAKDVWIVALNSRPTLLAQSAFIKLPDETATEGLSAKHISVGLLARHGFDLRDKLGFLLSDKFDFTGVSGIRTAYVSAFGKASVFDTMFNGQNIATLEATRHLIVHRAGFVDEEYKRRTKDATPMRRLCVAG